MATYKQIQILTYVIMEIFNDISSKNEIFRLQNNYYNLRNSFPQRVFKKDFKHFTYTTFEDILQEAFYSSLQKISTGKKVYFLVTKPLFSKHSILLFDLTIDTEKNYFNVLRKEFDDTNFSDIPIDLYTYSEECLIFSDNGDLALYCERELDIAIIAFKEEIKCNAFRDIFARSFEFDQILDILTQSFGKSIEDIPKDFRSAFESNYLE